MSSVCLASPYSQLFNPSRNAEQESYFISFQGVGHLPKLFIENGQASISLLQRRFRVGYTRAARIVDQMEQRGLVGPYEGSKPRQIKVTMARYNEMIENGEL